MSKVIPSRTRKSKELLHPSKVKPKSKPTQKTSIMKEIWDDVSPELDYHIESNPTSPESVHDDSVSRKEQQILNKIEEILTNNLQYAHVKEDYDGTSFPMFIIVNGNLKIVIRAYCGLTILRFTPGSVTSLDYIIVYKRQTHHFKFGWKEIIKFNDAGAKHQIPNFWYRISRIVYNELQRRKENNMEQGTIFSVDGDVDGILEDLGGKEDLEI